LKTSSFSPSASISLAFCLTSGPHEGRAAIERGSLSSNPEATMPALSTWNLDQTRLLTRRELAAVLADLAPRAALSANIQRNLVIVRLACCCGLRVSSPSLTN
jgi:hypothetical protein